MVNCLEIYDVHEQIQIWCCSEFRWDLKVETDWGAHSLTAVSVWSIFQTEIVHAKDKFLNTWLRCCNSGVKMIT